MVEQFVKIIGKKLRSENLSVPNWKRVCEKIITKFHISFRMCERSSQEQWSYRFGITQWMHCLLKLKCTCSTLLYWTNRIIARNNIFRYGFLIFFGFFSLAHIYLLYGLFFCVFVLVYDNELFYSHKAIKIKFSTVLCFDFLLALFYSPIPISSIVLWERDPLTEFAVA